VAGGTYTLKGQAYTQSLVYASAGMKDYPGKAESFTMSVEGDTLRQVGQLADGTKTEEVWQRVR